MSIRLVKSKFKAGKLILGVALMIWISGCGGSGNDQEEGLLTAPDWIQGEADGLIVAAERAWGRIWAFNAQTLEIIEKNGEKKPVWDLNESLEEIRYGSGSEGTNQIITTREGEEGCLVSRMLISGEGDYQESATRTFSECPEGMELGPGGELYLLWNDIEEAGNGIIARVPSDSLFAEEVTEVINPAEMERMIEETEVVHINHRAGEMRLDPEGKEAIISSWEENGWIARIGLPEFAQVEEIEWPVEITYEDKFNLGLITAGGYSQAGLCLHEPGASEAWIYYPGQAVTVEKIELMEMTGKVNSGDLGGEPYLAWVTLEGGLYLYSLERGCYHDLGGRYQSLAGSEEFTDEMPESDPKMKNLETSDCLGITRSEDWILTYNGDCYLVEGSVSGLQSQPAREGEEYVSDGGEISFLVQAGDKPTTEGDRFEFYTDDGIGGINVGAVARELFLDSERGLVWVADQAGGRIVIVDPADGKIEEIIK